jgi:spore maturation protein CgeB
MTIPSLRIAVVGPIQGGSLPVAAATSRALNRLGHTATFVDNSHHAAALKGLKNAGLSDEERRNREVDLFLLAANETQNRVVALKPQLAIYLAQAPVLSAANLERLRERNVPSVFWFVEDFRVFTYWQRAATRYDHVWAIQGEPFLSLLRQLGVAHVDHVPMACEAVDTSIYEPGFAAGDVTFVGSGYPNRVQFFAELANTNLRLFGPGFSQNAALAASVAADGVLPHEQLAALFSQSRINLNLSSTADPAHFGERKDFLNPRAFEICAARGFQLAERLLPIEDFFLPEEEIITFQGVDEANDKIRFYLNNEAARQVVAAKGMQRALAHHTYEARLGAALERLMKVDGGRVLASGGNVYG